jgi:hypothetical protein
MTDLKDGSPWHRREDLDADQYFTWISGDNQMQVNQLTGELTVTPMEGTRDVQADQR